MRPKGRNPMVNIRVDAVLFDFLQRSAKANARTVAGEAVFRLTKSMIEENLRSRYPALDVAATYSAIDKIAVRQTGKF